MHFSKNEEFSVCFIASGERAISLEKNGVTINGEMLHIPVIAPEKAHPVELIIVALKHAQLTVALRDLVHFIGENTAILSVMNGLDSESMIADAVGEAHILYCIAVGMDALRNGQEITYTTAGRLIFGELQNAQLSERVRAIQSAFDRAGINYATPEDMTRMLWWKFMINVGVNQATTVMQLAYGEMQTSTDAQFLMEALMREVIQLAQALHVNLSEDDITAWYPILNSLSPDGKTSMLQDYEAGRKSEVEIFAGKVVELGRLQNIPTPINEAVLHIVRVMERNFT